MKSGISQFITEARRIAGSKRVYTDMLRRIAWGTDAGFYKLVPQLVVRAANEEEVSKLLSLASRLSVPVTFRAAGTSLSGQAITDSVLIVAGKYWEDWHLSDDHKSVTLQPGLTGGRVSELLRPYGLTFTPDPASKNSAMVGGIVANNASGMNCGTRFNSDHMLRSARIVLADGTILDSADERSRADFRASHPEVIAAIEKLRDDVRSNADLVSRIRYKYSIKNVTGLNILPLVEHDDPIDIIAHSMVGSEGTLGFLSSVTMATGHLYPYAASAMVYFKEITEACRAVQTIKKAPVFSCELLDRQSLRSVNDTTGEDLTALLIETKADTEEELSANISGISSLLAEFDTFSEVTFTPDPAVYGEYWKKRSGIFPTVGAMRPAGTTVLIEDIAFHIDDLPQATADMQQLLVDHGYADACIYGHVLEGNYHFIISQSFDSEAEVDRYRSLMLDIERLVVERYDGSLKAEHGTGRNMAPFVRKEWGEQAWEAMRRLKSILDPKGLLNPGVIFNDDPECFVKRLKELPECNPIVDKCIECGFCEINCVSCGLGLSARQRIVLQRHITSLRRKCPESSLAHQLVREFRYLGNELCAGDGLCSTSCPMKINTGELIHYLRQQEHPEGSPAWKVGKFAADHLRRVEDGLRPVLGITTGIKEIIGAKAVNAIGRGLHKVGLPLWTSSLPAPYYHHDIPQPGSLPRKVVYFPSCINRTMGKDVNRTTSGEWPLVDTFVKLCNRAGYDVIFPEGMKNLCCGMIWESKGMPDIADGKTAELEVALLKASEGGKYPVVCDQSPCLHRMREHIKSLPLMEAAEFVHDCLAPYLVFEKKSEPVALHLTCSSRLMGITPKIIDLAEMCAERVVVPAEVGCCGFAGDKGFIRPELNRYALRKLRPVIEAEGVKEGYSNSRTCEIGLTTNSGIPYKSIVYLVESATRSTPPMDIRLANMK